MKSPAIVSVFLLVLGCISFSVALPLKEILFEPLQRQLTQAQADYKEQYAEYSSLSFQLEDSDGFEFSHQLSKRTPAADVCPFIKCATVGSPCCNPNAFANCTATLGSCAGSAQQANNRTARCDCHAEFMTCARDAVGHSCDFVLRFYMEICDNFFNGTNDCQCEQFNGTRTDVNFCNGRCDNVTNACVARSPQGGFCYEPSDCDDFYDDSHVGCDHTMCNFTEFSTPNDDCSSNLDCVGLNPCTNGKCVGKQTGVACTSSEECEFTLYCDASAHCAPQKQLGGSCIVGADNDECGGKTTCGAEGQCINIFSKANGAACNGTNECNFGLTCYAGVCSNAHAVTQCTSDSNCVGNSDGTDCKCNSFTGSKICGGDDVDLVSSFVLFSTACEVFVDPLFNCMNNSRCKGGNTRTRTSCGYKNCYAELWNAQNCIFQSYLTANPFFSCFLQLGPAPTVPSSSASTTSRVDSGATLIAPMTSIFLLLLIAILM